MSVVIDEPTEDEPKEEEALPSLNPSFFHVQPSSLSQGYEVSLPCGAPYENAELMRKMKPVKCRLCRLKNYSEMRMDFKRPLGERRLCRAVSMNDTATVCQLLRQGVSASCYDSQRRSPLHLAACKGYDHLVRILLNHGADPNARDSIGNTPLHLAACTNHINVIMLLLSAGTDACSIDKLGRSPLQLAQSKLKILQKSQVTDQEMKNQVSLVIEMLLYFSRSKEMSNVDTTFLKKFQDGIRITETREAVDNQLQDLLDSIGSLSIQK